MSCALWMGLGGRDVYHTLVSQPPSSLRESLQAAILVEDAGATNTVRPASAADAV